MTADAVGVPGAAGVLQFQARAVGQVAQESEVGVAVAAEDLVAEALGALHHGGAEGEGATAGAGDRKSGVSGKRVSVCVDIAGRSHIKKKLIKNQIHDMTSSFIYKFNTTYY